MMDEIRLTIKYLSEINRNLHQVELKYSDCFEAVKAREMFNRIINQLKDLKIIGISFLVVECETLFKRLQRENLGLDDEIAIVWLKALICKIKLMIKRYYSEKNWGTIY